MINFKKVILTLVLVFGICGMTFILNAKAEAETPNITIANFKYSNNSDLNVSTQIEFDLVNTANNSATFILSSWDDTTNFPLKSGLYTLTANQTVHVYLMDVNNISHLANGSNSINVKILSTDSATVYNSQDFTVIRGTEVTSPDLTVTDINFSSSVKNENGTLSVTVKNLGGSLTSGQGLFNWYNNLSAQNFIFSSETPSILAYRASRPDPTVSNPLKKDESITFSWIGKFNTSGNLYLQFTVDNANELDESNESNNTLSKSIIINDSTVTSTPNITIANFKYSNNYSGPLCQDSFGTIKKLNWPGRYLS